MNELNAIDQLSQGCQKSFRQLYDKYHYRVYHVGLSLGLNQNESLELVQDVFVIIWDKRKLLATVKSFEAYIVAITKNLTYKKLRSNAFEHGHTTYFKNEYSSIILPQSSIENEEIQLISNHALKQLSPQQREIFTLYTQESLSQQQIATQMNLSIRTVEHQIYLSKKKLKSFINSNLISVVIGFFLLF